MVTFLQFDIFLFLEIQDKIDIMDEIFLRFPHLDEQIFEKIDNKSLTNSRVVQRSWHNFIDENDYP